MFASLLLLAAAVSACDAEAVRAELRRECDARMIAGAVVMCSGLERPVVDPSRTPRPRRERLSISGGLV